jgi:hypothetical protein
MLCRACHDVVHTGRRRGKRTWWRPRDEPIGAGRMMLITLVACVGLIWVWWILMNILKV